MRSTRNLLPVMIILPLVLDKAVSLLDLGNLSQYTAGLVAIPLLVGISATGNIFGVGDRMLTIATKRNIIIIFNLISPFVSFFFSWLFLVQMELGWLAIPLYGFIPSAILNAIKLIYVFKKILPNFKFTGWWQSVVAPLISAAGMGIIGYLIYLISGGIFDYVDANFAGSIMADVFVWVFVVFIAFLLFIGNPIIYQLFYAFFGGWDDDSLEEYRKGVILSGPSAWMVKPIYWVAEKVSKISPLHNRFPIKNQERVKAEIQELEELRSKNLGKTG